MELFNLLKDRVAEGNGPVTVGDHVGTLYIGVPGIVSANICTHHGRVSVSLSSRTRNEEFTMDSAAELVTEYLIQECLDAVAKGQMALRALEQLKFSKHRKRIL